MLLEKIVYQLLSSDTTLVTLVGDRINPSQPHINSDLAYLTYMVSSTPQPASTDGVCALEQATLTVDVWALNSSPLYDILEALKALLHGHRDTGDGIHFMKLDSHSTDRQTDGYHGVQVYSCWWTDADFA
jgi:hypothetical protein